MPTAILLFAMTLTVPAAPMAPKPCSVSGSANLARLFIEAARPRAADTVMSVRLCLIPPRGGVGSYSAMVTFDSTALHATRVDVSGGMQVANANVTGIIRLAGAAPAGFLAGPLATITFRRAPGSAEPRIRLTLAEANSPTGVSVIAGVSVSGYPATDSTLGRVQTTAIAVSSEATGLTPKGVVPHVDSIAPRSGQLDAESVLDLTIYGKGFTAAGNSVLFDAATVEGLMSELNGRVLRFMAPTLIPGDGKGQSRRIAPGKYQVRVRTNSGTSNAVTFTVRGDDR
jgi:hypothetical protein